MALEETLTKQIEETDNNQDDLTHCPECDSEHITRDYDRGEDSCEDCGLVLNENLIDPGPEWRAFDTEQEKKRERTGTPTSVMMHDKGLSTVISNKNKDAYGRNIKDGNQRAQIYRLRKWQNIIRISNSTEKNLVHAFTEINKVSSKIGLPTNVRETAAIIYKKALNKQLTRGRSIESVSAASLYGACRQCGVPRTLDEVAAASRKSKREIGRYYRLISRELNLKIMPPSPNNYIARFCSELKLSPAVEIKTSEILKDAEEIGLNSGRGPSGSAAAAIYLSSIICNEKRSQKEIAYVAGVTDVTIRNRYKELNDTLNLGVEIGC